ncbi:unnamed protein product [Didymodactylos carnosus]|uniref:USP domain-containing protein n=1 Tax=Didymodactylos carnosus TaxID=1234261 RepID=A0A8S2EIB4_9BILA|nr:unnamed protein product [Didymodactylos carnosus]CAF3991848.1 unnamed protein product [Didymodactylos carnosus]
MSDVRSPGATIQPDAFISRLRYVDSKYVVGIQQDAEEFMAQAFVTMTSNDTKICMIMEHPKTLDIGPFIVPEDQSHSSSRYTLYGMVVHQGLSIDSGHYYTYVKSNKAWKLINDKNVTDMNMSDVLKADKLPNDSTSMAYSNAYILCYEQQTDENFEMDCTTEYTSTTKDQKKETRSLNNGNVTDNQKNEKLFSNSRASIENDMVNNIFERPTKHGFDEEELNSEVTESSDKTDELPIRIKITSSTFQNEHDSATTTRCKDTLLTTKTASDLLGANVKKAFKCVIEKHHEIQMNQFDLKILLKQEETTDIVMDDKFIDMTPADDEYDVSQLHTNVPNIFKIKKQSTQFSTWISNEENSLNSVESSIKSDMVKIFENVCRSADKYELVTTKSTKPKKKSADNESQLSPYEKFIVRFNKLYMGTVHMWSNILLGDLQRYRDGAELDENDKIDHIQRTTGSSEKRMWFLKNIELNKKIHKRLDIVIDAICKETIAVQRTAALQMYTSLSKKYKNIEERWNKKKHGYVPIVQLMEREEIEFLN